jgi:hypothetical protein
VNTTPTETSEVLEEAPKETSADIPESEITQLAKHYAVDFRGRGTVLPVRKTEVTTRLISQCKPGVVKFRGFNVRYYLAEG